MLDQADIALLSACFFILAISLWCAFRALKRDSWAVQKYKLFKVRDELIYLVATGKLPEDDLIFNRFYKASTFFIEHSNEINLVNWIAAAEQARKKGLDPAERANYNEIQKRLKHASPEVKKAANDFYEAFLLILVENSLVLRLISRFNSMAAAFKFVASIMAPLPSRTAQTRKAALEFYCDYRRAAAAAA
jgi:hypothetical protein